MAYLTIHRSIMWCLYHPTWYPDSQHPSPVSSLVSKPQLSIQAFSANHQLQHRSHKRCTSRSWPSLSSLKETLCLGEDSSLPILQTKGLLHIICNQSTQTDLPPHSRLWTGSRSCIPVHSPLKVTIRRSHFQSLDLTHPHIFFSTPFCSVYNEIRTNKGSL